MPFVVGFMLDLMNLIQTHLNFSGIIILQDFFQQLRRFTGSFRAFNEFLKIKHILFF